MNNKTLLLTSILLKNGEGFGIKGSKNIFTKILFILLIFFMGPGIAGMLAVFMLQAYDVLITIGQEGILISWVIAVNSLIIFIFGIFYIVSIFYMSTDIESLLHLPLRPRQIIGAKFMVVVLYEYLITAVIFLPALLVYGIKGGLGAVYYFYGLIVLILMPVLPLAISSILVMIIMRFTNAAKHKDAFKLLGGLVAIAFGIGFNVIFSRFTTGAATGNLEELLLKGDNSMAAIASGLFPTAKWASQAIINNQTLSGLYNLLLYIGVSVVIYICLIFLAELVYFKGVKGISETGSKRYSGKKLDYNKALVKSTALKTLTLIEIKLLFRTPIYFLNCVLINFIWPLFMLLPTITAPKDADIMDQFIGLLQNAENPGKILAGIFAALFFLGGANGIAPTAISREGQEIFVRKYIPAGYKKQLGAKVLSSVIIGYAGILIFIAFAVIVFKLPLSLAFIVVAIGWIPILLTSYIGILIDVFNPKLVWDNEQKAVKQNMNVLYSMAIGSALGILTIVVFFNLKMNTYLLALVLFAVYGTIVFVMHKLVFSIGVRAFYKLEG